MAKVKTSKVAKTSLFTATPRSYGIGQATVPKKDMHAIVRWPRYVKLQRHKRVLMQRLRVPPALNQFNNTLASNGAAELFTLLHAYKPETSAAKKERLQKAAEAKVAGKEVETTKPTILKFGINHITSLVESKKAKLVVIAHDVDPIEIVLWLPALCRATGTPYVIVKGKARLGQLTNQKTSTAVALVDVKPEDEATLAKMIASFNVQFAENKEILRKHGGNIKSARTLRKEAARAAELL